MKRDQQKVIGRVIRIWEVVNAKKGNEIITLNFLLPDEKVSGSNTLYYFKIVLKIILTSTILSQMIKKLWDQFIVVTLIILLMIFWRKKIYVFNDFEVRRVGDHYKISKHAYTILLNDHSTIIQISDEIVSINLEKFMFCDYDELMVIADKNQSFDDM